MTEDIQRLHEVFASCLAQEGEARQRTLDDLCGDDHALKSRVQRLLERHRDSATGEGGFLRLDANDPDRIGPYRLLQRLGEGGMGIVYAAEQREPVRRRVALKVLRHGHGSREVVARFDAERHALALMNHPNIARIFDAGTTADHRPYIVMEFVPGKPLTRYCEQHGLGLRERLALFRSACNAVQHAHQRGVIHRDLKPSNILVMEEDSRAVVKIIDFGIAKAISHRLTDHTLETKVGSLLGTPDYMSPEQAELSPLDVDTRADVYALGTVLYELLAGAPPLAFSGADMSYADMLRVIHEEIPVPPSQRLDGVQRRQVRGELDWIALKALEKRRNDRYASAADFERDIRAYLEDGHIAACPPSPLRGLRRFVCRHWLGTGAAIMAVIALGALHVELLDRNRELEAERDRASREAAIARQVTYFTAGLFEFADPADSGRADTSARALLDAGVARLQQASSGQPPEVKAALFAAAASAYQGLGLHERAEALLQESVTIYRNAPQADAAAFADALGSLAQSKRERGLLAAAERLEREALDALAPDMRAAFGILTGLAETLRDQGRLDEAAAVIEPPLRTENEERFDPIEYAYALSLLGSIRTEQGRFDDAEKLLLQAMARQRRGGGESRNNLGISGNRLAALYLDTGRPALAESLLHDSLAAARARYGERHPEVATNLSNLANAIAEFPGRHAEAEALYREALAIRRETVGETHPATLTVKSNLGWLYGAMQDWPKAHALYTEVAAAREQLFGADHLRTANARLGQARAVLNLGRNAEAVRVLRDVVAVFSRQLGEQHWRTADVQRVLGNALVGLAQRAEGMRQLQVAHDTLAAALGEDHERTRQAKADLEHALNGSVDTR